MANGFYEEEKVVLCPHCGKHVLVEVNTPMYWNCPHWQCNEEVNDPDDKLEVVG